MQPSTVSTSPRDTGTAVPSISAERGKSSSPISPRPYPCAAASCSNSNEAADDAAPSVTFATTSDIISSSSSSSSADTPVQRPTMCAAEFQAALAQAEAAGPPALQSRTSRWSYLLDSMRFLSYCEDPASELVVNKRLGKGAYGIVYRAVEKQTQQVVAVKVMPLMSEYDEWSKKLATEIYILHNAGHPNITHFKRGLYSHKEIWIVLEYCTDGNLMTMLKKSGITLNEDQLQVTIKQLVRGLVYLHSLGVIHRDIKGENVLLSNGVVKLSDFGVASVNCEERNRRRSVAGSTYWMAPEVALGDTYDTSADIWSLGITMIELIEKFPPYYDLLPIRQIFMLTNEDVPVPTVKDHKIYSVEMLEFLSLCLQREPRSRPSATALLHHPWLRDGVPRRYESDFVRFYVSHARDLLDDIGGDEEEEDSQVVVGGGNESPLTSSGSVVTDLSSGSEEEEDTEESTSSSSPARSLRRSIFLPRTKPIQTLQELEEAMRSKTSGVPTKTRKQLLRTYKHTFLGNDAVDWMMIHMEIQTRAEAVAMGQLLVYRGKIRHITDSEPFQDKPIWFRFVDEEKEKKKAAKKEAKKAAKKEALSLRKMRKRNKSFIGSPVLQSMKSVDDLNMVDRLIAAMKNPQNGVSVRDRKQLFPPRVFPDSFVGHEALDWMMGHLSKGADEAASTLQLLMDRGAIEHVNKRYPFKSDNEFYRFVESGNGGATSDDTWRRSLSHLGMDIRASSSNTASGSASASSSAHSVEYDSNEDEP